MHIYTGSSISFQSPKGFKTVNSDHPKFDDIVALCNAKDYAGAVELYDVKTVVQDLVEGTDVKLVGSQLIYLGQPVSGLLGERIIKMANLGLTVQPLINFLKNLQDNPSSRAVEELYGFLESSKLPITDDGHFLAYKSVRSNYTDHHSGRMDNSVGTVVSMARNKVNENKDQTCSYGLHFAAHEYAHGFGGPDSRMMVMKINPAHVVSIPSDYNNQKGRCCEYLVLEEVTREDKKLIGASVIDTAVGREWTKNTGSLPVAEGTRVDVRHRNGSEYTDQPAGQNLGYDNNRAESWGLGYSNSSIAEWRLTPVATKVTYVPQVDNYEDGNLWNDGDEFTGLSTEFPVNRGTEYDLRRLSTGRYYDDYVFCEYDEAHDNLKFYCSKHNNYITVSDVDDWDITWMEISHSSNDD